MPDVVRPVTPGDWVASLPSLSFQIGRVKDSYFGDGEFLVDVVLYDPDGGKIGRVSPRCGGPRSFEPAMLYAGAWRRIREPVFPLTREVRYEPCDRPGYRTVCFDEHGSVTAIAERTEPVKRRGRFTSVYHKHTRNNFDPELEKAALRRAAQELRSAAKQEPSAADGLRKRAAELEAEAAKL